MYDATINGRPLSDFHAQLIGSLDISPATVITLSDWPCQALNPLNYGTQKQYKIIKLSFLIRDTGRDACQLNISNLCMELLDCTVKFADISYYYGCALQDTPVPTEKAHNRYQLDVTLQSAYAYLPAMPVTLSGMAQTITVQGNLPSLATVTLTPTQDIGSVTLSGLTKNPITISNLHAGAPVTIDGENCLVTEPDLDTIMTTAMGAGKWMYRKYSMVSIMDPDNTRVYMVPSASMIPDNPTYTQMLIPDATDLRHNQDGYDYLGHIKTGINLTSAKTVTFKFLHDDGVDFIVDGVSKHSTNYPENNTTQWPGYPSVGVSLSAGWHTIEFWWIQHFGDDGVWGLSPTITSQVAQLNAYYARDAVPPGTVNKFGDTDMWAWPVMQPGAQTVSVSSTQVVVRISYKPKFM